MNLDLQTVFPKAGQSQTQPSAPTEDEPPPPYTTLPRSPSEAGATPWTGPGAGAGTGYAPSGVRLGYVDFVPRIVRKRMFKDDDYETFENLIARANAWFEEHHSLTVVSCETVTWMGLRTKNIFPDSCAFCKSMNADKQSKYLQGLRAWYFAEVFPSANQANDRTAVIRVKTYVPSRNERFDQLVKRANDHLAKETLGGRIVSVETIRVKYPEPDGPYSAAHVNYNRCFWKDYPDSDKRFVLCIRVYALFGEDMPGYESIGFQDFVPEHNQRNAENDGYEVFSDVMSKAAHWVARQQGVRFTNLQTVSVKPKKKGPFEERCIFTEHMCANNRSNILKGVNRKTPYLRIVRSFFVIHQCPGLRPEYPSVRLTYRTFTPAQITNATVDERPEYEGMRQMLERINQWLQITGAKVFSIETIPVRMTTGGLQLLGPEATFSPNSRGNQWTERWLYHVRIYLDGEYLEPPGAVSLVVPSVAVITRSS